MLALNTPHRQPPAAFWYLALPSIVVAFLIVIVGGLMRDVLANACAASDCPPYVQQILPALVLISIAGVLLHPILTYILFTFSLEEHAITVNSGIVFRQYETITFERIQTLDLERGPILWLFGLTEVQLWTASTDQLNDHEAHTHAKPDTTLILARDTAQEFKDHVSEARKIAV